MNTRKKIGGGSLLLLTVAFLAMAVSGDNAALPNSEESLQQPSSALP